MEIEALMSNEPKSTNNDDIRKKPIAADKLWEALRATLDIFGPSMKEATILELQKSGLEPDAVGREFTLAEVRDRLRSIFGTDGTDVIIEQVARRLKSDSEAR
jgi:hypothetical protein